MHNHATRCLAKVMIRSNSAYSRYILMVAKFELCGSRLKAENTEGVRWTPLYGDARPTALEEEKCKKLGLDIESLDFPAKLLLS